MKSSYVALNVYIEIAYDGSELMSPNNLQVTRMFQSVSCWEGELLLGKSTVIVLLKSWGSHICPYDLPSLCISAWATVLSLLLYLKQSYRIMHNFICQLDVISPKRVIT